MSKTTPSGVTMMGDISTRDLVVREDLNVNRQGSVDRALGSAEDSILKYEELIVVEMERGALLEETAWTPHEREQEAEKIKQNCALYKRNATDYRKKASGYRVELKAIGKRLEDLRRELGTRSDAQLWRSAAEGTLA